MHNLAHQIEHSILLKKLYNLHNLHIPYNPMHNLPSCPSIAACRSPRHPKMGTPGKGNSLATTPIFSELLIIFGKISIGTPNTSRSPHTASSKHLPVKPLHLCKEVHAWYQQIRPNKKGVPRKKREIKIP